MTRKRKILFLTLALGDTPFLDDFILLTTVTTHVENEHQKTPQCPPYFLMTALGQTKRRTHTRWRENLRELPVDPTVSYREERNEDKETTADNPTTVCIQQR